MQCFVILGTMINSSEIIPTGIIGRFGRAVLPVKK